MVDVKNKKCIHEGCKKLAYNNFKDNPYPLYCGEHKLPGMVDIKNLLCIHESCSTRSTYNFEGKTKALYCKLHKLPKMIDIKNKRCKTDLCDTILTRNKYKGYCAYCYINLFPDEPLSRNYKTKELSVVEFIKTQFKDYTWVNDKSIEDGCSKRRPDLLVDFGPFVLIIEIDENNHRNYTTSCENKRLMILSKDLNSRPIVMIRFNPDSYTNEDGKKIKSPWVANKNTGILIIGNKKEWNLRLDKLKETVEYWSENGTEKTIEIVSLFKDSIE